MIDGPNYMEGDTSNDSMDSENHNPNIPSEFEPGQVGKENQAGEGSEEGGGTEEENQ